MGFCPGTKKCLYFLFEMFKRLKDFISMQETLEDKLFWGVLVFVTLAALLSTVFTSFEGMGPASVVFCIITSLTFVLIGLIAQKTGKVAHCYFAICIVVNVILLPPLFFACGGFAGGMGFYCFIGLFLCTLYNHTKRRFLLILISLCSYEMTFLLARLYPQYVTSLDANIGHLDFSVSFFLMAIVLYVIIAFFMRVFDRERRQKDVLIKKLDFYSKRDPLTGLFNRRHFINYLDQMIWPERKGFYVMMYDIDDFKKVNDGYGHPFGDKVLCEVANVAAMSKRVSFGECAVRYGGEEFIQLFYAQSYEEAYARAEQLRRDISAIRFEQFPDVRVTISGGFVSCTNMDFDHQNKMLSFVDGLLYLAKSRGKNQICDKQ